MTQRRMSSLDCLKGVSCLAVVLLHFASGTSNPWLIGMQAAMRFAVPVFFAISGYFLLSSGQVDSRKVRAKLRRLLALTLWSAVFHALYIVCSNLAFHPGWSARAFMAEWLSADKLVLLLVQNSPFVYSHLWFIFALMDCYLFSLAFFRGTRNRRWIYILSPVLMALFIVFQEGFTYFGLPRTFALPGTAISVTIHNIFIFRALPFFLLGVILREQRERIISCPISRSALIILALFGGALSVAERFFVANTQYFIGSHISAVAMLILCMKEPDMRCPRLRYIGENLSMHVYVIHMVVFQVLDGVASKLHMDNTLAYALAKLPLALMVTLLSAEVIHRISRLLRPQHA